MSLWRVYAFYPNSDSCDFWTCDTETEATELLNEYTGDPTYSRVTHAKLTREEIELSLSELKKDAAKGPIEETRNWGLDPNELYMSTLTSIERFEKALKEINDEQIRS